MRIYTLLLFAWVTLHRPKFLVSTFACLASRLPLSLSSTTLNDVEFCSSFHDEISDEKRSVDEAKCLVRLLSLLLLILTAVALNLLLIHNLLNLYCVNVSLSYLNYDKTNVLSIKSTSKRNLHGAWSYWSQIVQCEQDKLAIIHLVSNSKSLSVYASNHKTRKGWTCRARRQIRMGLTVTFVSAGNPASESSCHLAAINVCLFIGWKENRRSWRTLVLCMEKTRTHRVWHFIHHFPYVNRICYPWLAVAGSRCYNTYSFHLLESSGKILIAVTRDKILRISI